MDMKKTMEMYLHFQLTIWTLIAGSDSAFTADGRPIKSSWTMYTEKTMEMYNHFQLTILPVIAA